MANSVIFLLFTGFTIGITGAMIPGPLTFFTVSETLKTDKFAGLKTILGHIAIEFILVLLIFFGFQNLFSSDIFLTIISIIGGLALAAMGVVLILNSKRMKMPDKEGGPVFSKGLFVGGMFFSAVSPGFLIWWATIGVSTVVKALLFGITGVILLALGHWLADILWYCLISYTVDKGKAYLNDNMYRGTVRFFSVLLVMLGLYFFFFESGIIR